MAEKIRPASVSEKLVDVVAKNYPGSDILVSFPDHWELVHRLKRAYKPRYIAGFPPSYEQPRGNQFFGLSHEINQSLTVYRLYKLFEPCTTYMFQMEWNTGLGQGRIIGGGNLRVHLQPVGQAQIWKGDACGVLWECFANEAGRQQGDWQEQLATFWRAVERDMAVQKIFTQPHEPTFVEGYTEFLSRLGYTPDPDFEKWWSKKTT